MKPFFLAVSLALCCSSVAQNLKNTSWAKIDIKRNDGSRILNPSLGNDVGLSYAFKDSLVFVTVNGQGRQKIPYTVKNNELILGELLTLKIDTINGLILKLTEQSDTNTPGYGLNTTTFINDAFHFKYLRQYNLIQVLGDTLIECNAHFSPLLLMDALHSRIREIFPDPIVDRGLNGFLILSPKNQVHTVQVEDSNAFSEGEIKKLIEILTATNGKWTMPKGASKYYLKVNFSLSFPELKLSGRQREKPYEDEPWFTGTMPMQINYKRSSRLPILRYTHFTFHSTLADMDRIHTRHINSEEQKKYFEKGLQLSNKGRYHQAIAEFDKVIALDSLNVDAYYNKADLHFNLGQRREACQVWKKLVSLEQIQSAYLYYENCQ